MQRLGWTFVVLVVLSVGLAAPVAAQESKVQVNVGASFPLISRTFEIEQSLAYQANFLFRAHERVWLGLIYESRSTEDDLGTDQDVDIQLMGITGVFVLSGDPGFELIGLASVGTGEIEWMNDAGFGDPLLRDSTDIDLWYEAGLGAQFRRGDHLVIRVAGTIRRVHPKVPSELLQQSRTSLVPSFTIGYSF